MLGTTPTKDESDSSLLISGHGLNVSGASQARGVPTHSRKLTRVKTPARMVGHAITHYCIVMDCGHEDGELEGPKRFALDAPPELSLQTS